MGATLESTRGARLELSELRGRVAVVFYEAKGHEKTNEPLKRACAELLGPGRPLVVLGVADLRGLGFGPVRAIVQRAVGAVAARYGAELFLDFDGVLRRAPFGFSGGGSEIAILDTDGRVVYRASGRLDGDDVDRCFAALTDALGGTGAPLPTAA